MSLDGIRSVFYVLYIQAILMTTREIIDRYYESANAGDWDNYLALFADNVVIDEQLAGHIEGIETLRDSISGLERGYSRFKNSPQSIVIDDEQVCVVSHIDAANAEGVPIEADAVNYFRLQNDKIIYMANFHDTKPFDPFVNQDLD